MTDRSDIGGAAGRGPVVVVTGASAGVGRAVARRYARDGARLGLIAREPEALETVAGEVRARGGEALVLPLDVAEADAVFAAADEVERKFGPPDIWVNDAMATVFSPVADITPEEFRRVTDVDYLGFVHGTMAALRSMRRRDRGVIVQVGSALAFRGLPLQAAYCGAKHAMRGFTNSLRAELFAEGSQVRLSIVELPAVNTPQFDWARTKLRRASRPMGGPVQPHVAADAIHRAARRGGREYWLGRSTVLTILGEFLAPWFLDRHLGRIGVEGQQTDERVAENRPDNLDQPAPARLHRVTGSFDDEASDRALLVHGPTARLGAAALGLGAAFAFGLALG